MNDSEGDSIKVVIRVRPLFSGLFLFTLLIFLLILDEMNHLKVSKSIYYLLFLFSYSILTFRFYCFNSFSTSFFGFFKFEISIQLPFCGILFVITVKANKNEAEINEENKISVNLDYMKIKFELAVSLSKIVKG